MVGNLTNYDGRLMPDFRPLAAQVAARRRLAPVTCAETS